MVDEDIVWMTRRSVNWQANAFRGPSPGHFFAGSMLGCSGVSFQKIPASSLNAPLAFFALYSLSSSALYQLINFYFCVSWPRECNEPGPAPAPPLGGPPTSFLRADLLPRTLGRRYYTYLKLYFVLSITIIIILLQASARQRCWHWGQGGKGAEGGQGGRGGRQPDNQNTLSRGGA